MYHEKQHSGNWAPSMNKALGIALLLATGVAAISYACDSGTVRDAAFQEKRDLHRLCVIANQDDPAGDEQYERLSKWLETDAKHLNAVLERVASDDPAVRWEEYGIPSAPPSLPVVALVGKFASLRRAFVVEHWEPAPTDKELATLVTSPARDELKEGIRDYWAVVLYSPGTGDDKAKEWPMLKAVEKRWAEEQSPGVVTVPFDRNDPRERVLTSFTGLKADGPSWAGVVFGKGKLMAPPIQGDDLTEENLNRLVAALAVPCTCLQESTTMGLDVPMTWEPDLDAKFASLSTGIGYSEITFGEEAYEEQIEEAVEEMLVEEAPEDRNTVVIALASLGAAALLAFLGVAWTVARRPKA